MQDRGAKNAEEEKLRKEEIRKPKTQPCKTKPAKIRHPAEKARSKSSRRVKDVPPARRGRCSGFSFFIWCIHLLDACSESNRVCAATGAFKREKLAQKN